VIDSTINAPGVIQSSDAAISPARSPIRRRPMKNSVTAVPSHDSVLSSLSGTTLAPLNRYVNGV
jgi:hypothetical protein